MGKEQIKQREYIKKGKKVEKQKKRTPRGLGALPAPARCLVT